MKADILEEWYLFAWFGSSVRFSQYSDGCHVILFKYLFCDVLIFHSRQSTNNGPRNKQMDEDLSPTLQNILEQVNPPVYERYVDSRKPSNGYSVEVKAVSGKQQHPVH